MFLGVAAKLHVCDNRPVNHLVSDTSRRMYVAAEECLKSISMHRPTNNACSSQTAT